MTMITVEEWVTTWRKSASVLNFSPVALKNEEFRHINTASDLLQPQSHGLHPIPSASLSTSHWGAGALLH